MSSVKINDKNSLERLSAKIFLQTGKKFTQQELLSLCVEYSLTNIDELITNIITENRTWTEEELQNLEDKFIEDFGEGTENLSNNIDNYLYGRDKDDFD